MITDDKKGIVRRYAEEVWSKGNPAVVDELVATDYVLHHPANSEAVRGPEGLKHWLFKYRTAFPDLQFTLEDVLAEGVRVAVHWTARGTHQGEFMGIPPTGKQVTMDGITIYRVPGDRIGEERVVEDMLNLMQQLGATITPPGQAAG